jgi:hypothetical protein
MIRIQNSLASSLYDTYPEFIDLFPVWYVSRIHWPLPCMMPIQNSPTSSPTSRIILVQKWILDRYDTEIRRRVWRYQRGNQNLHIEEEQTTQWPKEKVQKDKQRSTK